MRNILIINNGIVVDIIQEEDEWNSENYTTHAFDTACDDPSERFQIGEEYTIEKMLEYNGGTSTSSEPVASRNVTEFTRSDTGEIIKLTTRI